MINLPKTFDSAVSELDRILDSEQKEELKALPFLSINVEHKTDFFSLVIDAFMLNEGNDELLIDIAKQNTGAVLNEDFLSREAKADASNGARLILEKLKAKLCSK